MYACEGLLKETKTLSQIFENKVCFAIEDIFGSLHACAKKEKCCKEFILYFEATFSLYLDATKVVKMNMVNYSYLHTTLQQKWH